MCELTEMSYNDIYKKKTPYAVGKGKSAGNCRAISSDHVHECFRIT